MCFISNNNEFAVAFHQQSAMSLMQLSPLTSKVTTTIAFAAMSPEEERAAALSDYLAKAHEEKLRLIKEVEQKKNQEIDQLKQQIAELKSQPTASSSSSAVVMVNGADSIAVKALDNMNKEELMAKVLQYQNFMRQYMIDAQEEKYRAVQEAQAVAQKKLAESLSLLGLSPVTSGTAMLSSSVTESPLYTARNVAVSKAGTHSRWGPMEVERVSSGNSIASTPINGASSSTTTMSVNGGSVPVMSNTATSTATTPIVVPVPPEVAEADHGLRSDGSIGGLTLAERIYFGSKATPAVTTTTTTITTSAAVPSSVTNPMEVLYQKRNIKVVQAAQAGKSNRWGAQEVERVSNIVAATTGLSSSTAGTASAQQRVNFGASILGQK